MLGKALIRLLVVEFSLNKVVVEKVLLGKFGGGERGWCFEEGKYV